MTKCNNKIYLVVRGRMPGAYQYNEAWADQVESYPNYKIKGFKHLNLALDWWRANDPEQILSESQIRKAFEKRDNDAKTAGEIPLPEVENATTVTKEPSAEIIQFHRSPLEIYTDGSLMGKQEAGGWAAVILSNEKIVLRLKGRIKKKEMTSSSIELLAIHKTLKFMEKHGWNLNETTIMTDSQYIMKHWLKNVRPNDDSKKVWKKVWKRLVKYNASIVWIKGHAGNTYNEECDRMAKEAASEQLTLLKAKKIKKNNHKTAIA